MVCNTAAAPDISDFMASMPWAGLIERPPESNVMPLPTSATCCARGQGDRKSTRLNSSHVASSYAVFCLKKKNIKRNQRLAQVTAETQCITRHITLTRMSLSD